MSNYEAGLGPPARNTVAGALQQGHGFTLHTRPNPVQAKAFERLGLAPVRVR